MKRNFMRSMLAWLALCCLAASHMSRAAVTPEEANRLNAELTPMGAEKVGNKDGTIPAWNGGYTKVPAGYKQGDPRPDPFAGEKPLFSVSAKNMDQFPDRLAEGVKALMKKYQGFRIDVYPTHRTAALPQWGYDNTFSNATRCKATNGGLSLEDCYGGIPFPIPKTGHEVMWNHLLSWRGMANDMDFRSYVGTADGRLTMAVDGITEMQSPYWFKDGSLEKFNGEYFNVILSMNGPPFKAGESFLIRDHLDQVGKGRQAWQYLTGQRRVRKAPTLAYDTPDTVQSGTNYYDEAFVFFGALDRFDWKIVGKKEMFIPYNSNRTWLMKIEDVVRPNFLNPDAVRWELHRVWVVEANLAPGKRNAVPKRRFYIDEDTWIAALNDSWDAQGQLWRMNWSLPIVAADLPGTVFLTFGIYNFLDNTYNAVFLPNGKPFQFKQVAPRSENFYTPDNLATRGTR